MGSLHRVSERDWFSPQSRKEAERINRRIDEINASLQGAENLDVESKNADMMTADVEEVTHKARAAKKLRVQALRDELGTRRDMAPFFDQAESDRLAAEREAAAAVAIAECESRATLMSEGYSKLADVPAEMVGTLMDLVAKLRGSVLAAVARHAELREAAVATNEWKSSNRRQMQAVANELKAIMAKAADAAAAAAV